MTETKHVAMNAKQQEQLDQLLRGIAKERKVAIEADLDSRLSYRDKDPKDAKAASWGAYSRFLLSDGHTVYVDLRKMTASVSKEVDKFAQAKVEKKLARQKKAADRKAAGEAKAGTKPVSKVKAKAVVHKAVDEAVKELIAGAVTSSKKLNARKAAKGTPVVKFDKTLSTLEG